LTLHLTLPSKGGYIFNFLAVATFGSISCSGLGEHFFCAFEALVHPKCAQLMKPTPSRHHYCRQLFLGEAAISLRSLPKSLRLWIFVPQKLALSLPHICGAQSSFELVFYIAS